MEPVKRAMTNRRGKEVVCRKRICKCLAACCKRYGCHSRNKKKKRCRKYKTKKRAKPSVIVPRLQAVTVHPIVQRFFFIPTTDIALTEEIGLRPDQFVNDEGAPARSFPDYRGQGYYNLFVNGVLQEGHLYAVSPEAIRLAKTGQSILANSPIILESVGFVVQVA